MLKSNVVENKMIIIGRVVEVSEGTGNAAGKAFNVKLEGKQWNGSENLEETVKVTFWEGRADRARKAIRVGQYVMIDAFVKGDNIYGNDFCFRGMYSLENGENSKVFFLGYPVQKPDSNGTPRFSIAIDTYDTETKTTETNWFGINWSNKIKANAEKLIRPNDEGKAPLCMIEAFPPTVSEANGKSYLNVVGLRFEILR